MKMYSLKDTKREPMTVKCIPSLSVENSNSSNNNPFHLSFPNAHTYVDTHSCTGNAHGHAYTQMMYRTHRHTHTHAHFSVGNLKASQNIK